MNCNRGLQVTLFGTPWFGLFHFYRAEHSLLVVLKSCWGISYCVQPVPCYPFYRLDGSVEGNRSLVDHLIADILFSYIKRNLKPFANFNIISIKGNNARPLLCKNFNVMSTIFSS